MTGIFQMVNGKRVEMTAAEVAALQASLPDPIAEPEKAYTFLEFMDLFTGTEQVALAGAAMSDPEMKLWYDRALGAQGILMSDERTQAGVNAMAANNIISAARAEAVLKGQKP